MITASIVILVIAGAAIIISLVLYLRLRRSQILQKEFGPEYERAVDQYGDQQRAEAELAARRERVRKLHIRELTAEEQSRFSDAWRKTQALFVDEPSRAVNEADDLVKKVMRNRGYPVGDFQQRAADVSVDHGSVVKNYRAAYEIAARNKSGKATTEDLRQAMVHYRSLFEELLAQPKIEKKEAA